MAEKRDYYEVLGVSKTATAAENKKNTAHYQTRMTNNTMFLF